jgi:hydrophobic/amphiphilic exporter-1 (mainly G- bacteria), HAE1 family
MWHLTNIAVRGRVITLVVALMLAGASIWALLGLKVELMPDIEFPYISVVTVYPNSTPDEVVNNVTSPIEKMIWDKWANRGLKQVTSTSASNLSIIMGEFEYGTDMSEVTQSINTGFNGLSLPSVVTDYAGASGNGGANPQIIPINMNSMPVVNLSLSGNLSAEQLKQIADNQVVPELQQVEGVLRVDVEGGQSDQVIISANPALMNKYGISMAQISNLLAASNSSVETVADTPLDGNVKLSDVAQVTQGSSPLSSISRTNGRPSVAITITKTDKANTVEIAQAVMAKVKTLQAQFGGGVQITTVLDQSEYITSSINQLWEKAIIGGILAISVVFLFLWAIRASLITAISIPLSILIGFLGMRLAGITINLFTLSAMSIAVGRLIDDSIEKTPDRDGHGA